MDLEDRLKKLQSLFTHALSISVTAKARYLAIAEGCNATPAAIALAKMNWLQWEARKTAIIAQMVALEEMESNRPDPQVRGWITCSAAPGGNSHP